MVGKTFKGLTDELLRWQTETFPRYALGDDGHVVHLRPELVVEIALDGVQVSTRYPGGVALALRPGPPLPPRQDRRRRRPHHDRPGDAVTIRVRGRPECSGGVPSRITRMHETLG